MESIEATATSLFGERETLRDFWTKRFLSNRICPMESSFGRCQREREREAVDHADRLSKGIHCWKPLLNACFFSGCYERNFQRCNLCAESVVYLFRMTNSAANRQREREKKDTVKRRPRLSTVNRRTILFNILDLWKYTEEPTGEN